jgi:hypothetical protein
METLRKSLSRNFCVSFQSLAVPTCTLRPEPRHSSRVHGTIRPLDGYRPLTSAETKQLAYSVLT